MPELPEVETLRRGLERTALHRRVVEVTVANVKVLKGQSEAILRERTIGKCITQVERRGKYLLITLAADGTAATDSTASPPPPVLLCIHLKMRGYIRVEEEAEPPGRYHCVTLLLEEREGKRSTLRFYDVWTWGEMRALYPQELAREVPSLTEMGEEPLAPTWSGDVLGAKLRSRRTAIKPALLDQAVVAGIGNIYADESLFRARIHPTRRANSLTETETERLAAAVRTVLTEAIAGGGTTSDDYFDVAGRPGSFRPLVYDRGGEPCSVCGAPLTRIRLGGRGTVFCANCQPITA